MTMKIYFTACQCNPYLQLLVGQRTRNYFE